MFYGITLQNGIPVSPHKGFSLIEAVIVLAIVAAILGAIWAAAASVSETRRVNQVYEAITLILAKFDEAYHDREVTGSESLTQFLVLSKTVPASMTNGSNTIYTPWGGTITVNADTYGSYDWRILIYINGNFPREACMEISRRLIYLTRLRPNSNGGASQLFFNPPNTWHSVSVGTLNGAANTNCGSTTAFAFTSYRQ